MAIEHIFLDDGGVLNDNSLRRPQWQRLVGEFFAPRLGGTPEAWSAANGKAAEGVFQRLFVQWQRWEEQPGDFAATCRAYNLDWLDSMCKVAGVAAPASEEERLALGEDATEYIMTRVRAAFPGAAETVRTLAAGYDVCTASGSISYELRYTLEGIGVARCFRRLYGSDLVQWPKVGPGYYKRVFADARVDPTRSLVLDDSPECVSWARDAGANGVLVGSQQVEGVTTIAALSDLPALLASGAFEG